VPDEWRRTCLSECEGAGILLRDSVPRWVADEGLGGAIAARIDNAAGSARAALEHFRGWLSDGSSSGASAGSGRYDCGSELFDLLLARGHWCSRASRELAADAASALDDALRVLHERARRAAAGGWPEVQQRLADAHPALPDYLPTYQRVWEA
jgi:hypothetical protein